MHHDRHCKKITQTKSESMYRQLLWVRKQQDLLFSPVFCCWFLDNFWSKWVIWICDFGVRKLGNFQIWQKSSWMCENFLYLWCYSRLDATLKVWESATYMEHSFQRTAAPHVNSRHWLSHSYNIVPLGQQWLLQPLRWVMQPKTHISPSFKNWKENVKFIPPAELNFCSLFWLMCVSSGRVSTNICEHEQLSPSPATTQPRVHCDVIKRPKTQLCHWL